MIRETKSRSDLSGLVSVLTDIAKKRAAAMEQMRAALEVNDVDAVLRHARDLCGITME